MSVSRNKVLLYLLFGAALGFETPASAFEQETHELMSGQAAQLSGLDDLLESLPEFWLGLGQKVDGDSVQTLIENGAYDEDEPFSNVFHHFHDPTRPWGDAGLLSGAFPSSIYWQQYDFVPNMWQNTRQVHLNALLETDAVERKHLFAQTFKSIGHIIHLVQDAASPAHTRDDPHVSIYGIGDIDRLHTWTAGNDAAEAIIASGAISFLGDLVAPTSDSTASRPVARLIDATEGDRAAPARSTDIGIAEYSNSQFLTEDRMFGANGYTYPQFAATESVEQSYTGTVSAAHRRYRWFSARCQRGRDGLPTCRRDSAQPKRADHEKVGYYHAGRHSSGRLCEEAAPASGRLLRDGDRLLLPRANRDRLSGSVRHGPCGISRGQHLEL